MNDKREWQEANRELMAEQRRQLGEPPTAEEMLAFNRGELSEAEEERIRDLIVAYPELARMFCEPVPEAPGQGDEDAVSPQQVAASWNALQQRLRRRSDASPPARDEAQRGRLLFMHHMPTAIAAALALVFFGLFVQAESRARYNAEQSNRPRILGAPQELDPDGNRGPGAATMLRKDGEAYLLKPHLINQLRFPHYQIELRDAEDVIWTNRNARPDADEAFQIVVPHSFLREGHTYQLRVLGVDGDEPRLVGTYDLSVPAE